MHGYSETILAYASDDSRAGTLEHPDGVGEVGLGAEEAGQRLAVRFTLQVAQERIIFVRYQVFGCGYTMAACAAAAQMAEGQALVTATQLGAEALTLCLGGLPEDRDYCAQIAVDALQAAVASVAQGRCVTTRIDPSPQDHSLRLSPEHPVYRALIESPAPGKIPAADRQLFAGLLAAAAGEPVALHRALNLSQLMLESLLLRVFPGIDPQDLFVASHAKTAQPPEVNPLVEQLLLRFVPEQARGWDKFAALALAKIIPGRAAHPGHLWIAMGLFERPQLSSAIGRLLPALLTANDKKMRWKRFLFKQVCDLNGATMCKSPVCGDCSDYDLCFAPQEDA